MYEATVCILQAVAFFVAKKILFIIYISLRAVEKNELKRVKNVI